MICNNELQDRQAKAINRIIKLIPGPAGVEFQAKELVTRGMVR